MTVLDLVYAEVQLFECASLHKDLCNWQVTPLMRLYLIRFLLERPNILPPDISEPWLARLDRDDLGQIEIAKMPRAQFLQYFLPVAEKLPRDIRP